MCFLNFYMSNKVCYGSFDIEADGPSPLLNNMLSIGVVFTDAETGDVIDDFLGDLEPLPDHYSDIDTMKEFWDRDDNNRAELKRIREHARPIVDVMEEFEATLKVLMMQGYTKVKWVARPAAYDWQWLNCYYQYYAGESKNKVVPLGFFVICCSTMRDMYALQHGLSFKEMIALCDKWAGDSAITHNPLDDAMYQSKVFHALLKGLQKK